MNSLPPSDSTSRERVDVPVAERVCESTVLRYYRLSIMSFRLMSSSVCTLCRLLAAAYYALLRHRAFIVNGFLAVVDVLTKGALYMPSKKVDPLLRPFRVMSWRPQAGNQDSLRPQEPEKSVHCSVLYDPGAEHRTLDIIFIHGLKGSLERTWTQGLWTLKSQDPTLLRKTASSPALSQLATQPSPSHSPTTPRRGERENEVSRCWPRDWLPQDCPGARVIALNYTTDPYLWRPVWINKRCRTSMSERAWEMMQHLTELGVSQHPIIWVGHSKGGLFVKQMLVHSRDSKDAKFLALGDQSKGILFYSVPHRGSPLANLNLPLLRQSVELTEVQKDSAEVTALHRRFRELLDGNRLSVEVRSFIETTLTLMSLVYVRIVSIESADAEVGELYGVPIDHRNICKPRSRDCFLYKELLSLVDWVTAEAADS